MKIRAVVQADHPRVDALFEQVDALHRDALPGVFRATPGPARFGAKGRKGPWIPSPSGIVAVGMSLLCQVCGAATRTQKATRDANGNKDRFFTKCAVCGDFRWLTPEPPGWAALPAIEGPAETGWASESTSWVGPAASKGPPKGKGGGRCPTPAQPPHSARTSAASLTCTTTPVRPY